MQVWKGALAPLAPKLPASRQVTVCHIALTYLSYARPRTRCDIACACTSPEHLERESIMRRTVSRVIPLFLSLLTCTVSLAPAQPAPAQPAPAQETGIKIKKPVFGGACKICPWGAIAEIVKASMQPYGYDVQICYNCATAEAPRIVAAARMPEPVEKLWQQFPAIPPSQTPPPPHGPVDFGATNVQNLWWAYQGTHTYAGEGPRTNLRLIAVIQSPNYLIVAVKADL